jgi:hypothetical protein
MTDYMVTGLVKKRAELAGELANIHNRVAQLVRDIEHIDATLQIVAPDIVPEAIPPRLFQPPEDWSKRGQMSRLVLGILRNAKEPLASRDIASQLILERGMAMDMKLLRLMTKRVGSALRDKREKGLVRTIEGAGLYQLWEIVR